MSNIKDLAPFLAYHFVDIEIDKRILLAQQTLEDEFNTRFGNFGKYLNILHDSWVIKTDIANNRFSLTLNDFTTHVFADALIANKKLTIKEDLLVFHCRLILRYQS